MLNIIRLALLLLPASLFGMFEPAETEKKFKVSSLKDLCIKKVAKMNNITEKIDTVTGSNIHAMYNQIIKKHQKNFQNIPADLHELILKKIVQNESKKRKYDRYNDNIKVLLFNVALKNSKNFNEFKNLDDFCKKNKQEISCAVDSSLLTTAWHTTTWKGRLKRKSYWLIRPMIIPTIYFSSAFIGGIAGVGCAAIGGSILNKVTGLAGSKLEIAKTIQGFMAYMTTTCKLSEYAHKHIINAITGFGYKDTNSSTYYNSDRVKNTWSNFVICSCAISLGAFCGSMTALITSVKIYDYFNK